MKKLLLTILATGAIALSPLLFAGSVSAYDALGNACGAGGANPLCSANEGDVDSAITNITNTIIFLLGAAAVIMIIIGGFMYVTAAGDAGRIKTAKNTILYAVIGLIVAIFAWAIVSFVVQQFS